MHTLRAPTLRAVWRRQSSTQTKASSSQQSNLGAVQVAEPHQYTRPEQVASAQGWCMSARKARAFLFTLIFEACRGSATSAPRGTGVPQRMSFGWAAGDAWRATFRCQNVFAWGCRGQRFAARTPRLVEGCVGAPQNPWQSRGFRNSLSLICLLLQGPSSDRAHPHRSWFGTTLQRRGLCAPL